MIELDDRWLRASWFSHTCTGCRHLDRRRGRHCPAFPDGIPDPIWTGDHDHRSPFPGDHGVRFAAMTDDDWAALEDHNARGPERLRQRWGDRAADGIRPADLPARDPAPVGDD